VLLVMAGLLWSAGSAAGEADTDAPLRIGLPPLLDAFPFYVAEARGHFAAGGVEVEAVSTAGGPAAERLMATGAVDGILGDLLSTAVLNRRRVPVKVVATVRRAYPGHPMFRILAPPGSHVRFPIDLKGLSIGIASRTLVEYVTDRLLQAYHVAPELVVKLSLPQEPQRLKLLMQARLYAATLTDLTAQSAMADGALPVIDDADSNRFALRVLGFSAATLESRPADVRAFLAAWNRAVADLRRDPASLGALLPEKIPVPANIRSTYRIPPYPSGEIPLPAQWWNVMTWAVAKQLLSAPLPYEECVTSEYLP
jgi:NitT/TauT family transport system substrate-binding protein